MHNGFPVVGVVHDFFSGHALANVLAATDAKLENTSLSAGAVDCPSKKSTTPPP